MFFLYKKRIFFLYKKKIFLSQLSTEGGPSPPPGGAGPRGGGLLLSAILSWTVAASGGWWAMSAVCLLTGGLMVLRIAQVSGGRAATLTAGWAAVVGPTLALGVVAIAGLQLVVGEAGRPLAFIGYRRVAGLEGFALPGVTVLCLSGMVVGWTRWAAAARVGVAIGLLAGSVLAAAAVLAAGLAE